MKTKFARTRLIVIPVLAAMILSTPALAGQTQLSQTNYDIGDFWYKKVPNKLFSHCDKQSTTAGALGCAAASGLYVASSTLIGLASGVALVASPASAALTAGAWVGDRVANISYNYVNSSTSKALGNLGNDSSEQGSYLWNAEHQPDPTEQRRQEMQDAMAAQGIYDDTPAPSTAAQ